jgi:hypothetical protein
MPKYTVFPTPLVPNTPRNRGASGRVQIDSITVNGKKHVPHAFRSYVGAPQSGQAGPSEAWVFARE